MLGKGAMGQALVTAGGNGYWYGLSRKLFNDLCYVYFLKGHVL